MNRTSWIDFQEWQNIGQPIKSTTSVEAVKLYDAAVCQYSSWFDNQSLGGLEGTLEKMQTADPNFLLGNAFRICCTLMGFTETSFNNDDIAEQVAKLKADSEKRKNEITDREYNHVQAVVEFANMNWSKASSYWEKVLDHSPTDMFAMKSELFSNFFTGQKMNNFHMIDRRYSSFENDPGYHTETIHGYYAFVMEEVGKYDLAEPMARKGLQLYPWDGWTTHALAHTLEMTGDFGIAKQQMDKTTELWNRANHIGCHNWWHLALFNVSLNDYDAAVEILDKEVIRRAKESEGTGPICDLNSLLYRLLFLNNKHSYDEQFFLEHFEEAHSISKQYHKKLVNPFFTQHYMMACLGSKRRSEAEELLDDFKQSKHAELYPEVNQVACDILQAFMYYDQENYSKATNLLMPIRDKIVTIGGSDAQRDVFNQLLLACALKSPLEEHKDFFQTLVDERENTKFNDWFISKLTEE